MYVFMYTPDKNIYWADRQAHAQLELCGSVIVITVLCNKPHTQPPQMYVHQNTSSNFRVRMFPETKLLASMFA